MIILDTSGLLACIDESQRWHHAAVSALQSERPPYLLSPFVLAELDYLLAKRVPPRSVCCSGKSREARSVLRRLKTKTWLLLCGCLINTRI